MHTVLADMFPACYRDVTCRAMLSDKRATRTCRHVTSRLFPNAQTHGLDSMSCRDVAIQVEFGLYRMHKRCWKLTNS